MGRFLALTLILAQAVAPQCGKNAIASPQNSQLVLVNAGPTGDYFNGGFTSVTLCVPGTSTCQTIDGMLVDTGSSGLRVLSTVLTLTLPPQTGGAGGAIGECAQFVDGFTWGPVEGADIKLASELARNVPVQVIGDSSFASIPADCMSAGAPENTLADLGAKGILGIGLFRQDCGIGCTFGGSSNPGLYYQCSSGSCQPTVQPLAQQLQNPVWLFASDNNGLMLQFPTVPIGGLASTAGMMTFGIGTQSDNAPGSAHVQTTDAAGNIRTTFNGQSYGSSFIDAGSNGIFFLDSAATGLPLCTGSTDFYCPPALRSLSATNQGVNGTAVPISFNIGNADGLNPRFSAFSEIGGPSPGQFIWGLPFFYGRTVFVGIEGQSTPAGVGPFWAY